MELSMIGLDQVLVEVLLVVMEMEILQTKLYKMTKMLETHNHLVVADRLIILPLILLLQLG